MKKLILIVISILLLSSLAANYLYSNTEAANIHINEKFDYINNL